jgi:hypothetical protein
VDPFARKMIRGSFFYGLALLVLFGVLTIFYLHARPRCSDQVISESTSPDGHSTAAVMEARCGEESPFLTHVNLRPAGDAIKLGYFSGRSEDGEVFLLEQDAQSASIKLEWTDATHLVISCSHCQIAFLKKRLEKWNGVSVSYFFDTR